MNTLWYGENISNFKSCLCKWGYPNNLIEEILSEEKFSERNFTLQEKEKVHFNNIVLPEVDHHKHLGLWLESSLSWDYHINSICAKLTRCWAWLKDIWFFKQDWYQDSFQGASNIYPWVRLPSLESLSGEAHQSNQNNSEKSVPTNMWPQQRVSWKTSWVKMGLLRTEKEIS